MKDLFNVLYLFLDSVSTLMNVQISVVKMVIVLMEFVDVPQDIWVWIVVNLVFLKNLFFGIMELNI